VKDTCQEQAHHEAMKKSGAFSVEDHEMRISLVDAEERTARLHGFMV